MDGTTTNNLNGTKSDFARRISTSRVTSLMFLSLVVCGLHLLLFNALDTVAPLGSDVIDSNLIVIESDPTPWPTVFENRVLDRLVADSR
jgi:hypothetical protein